jgi:hypothetical protein
MSEIQFLLDENVDPDFLTGLWQAWPPINVRRIGFRDAPPFGTPDPDILIWCETYQFSLITNNRHTMPTHLQDHLAAGRHVPGIVILNDRMSIGQTVAALAEIWSSRQPEKYVDQIIFLKPRTQ